eukprot:1195878-Prorocentrum_minimum.AAC.3
MVQVRDEVDHKVRRLGPHVLRVRVRLRKHPDQLPEGDQPQVGLDVGVDVVLACRVHRRH